MRYRRRRTGISKKRALVINQFTVPRSEGGITRHVDLFGALENWDAVYIAGSRNYNTQDAYSIDDKSFKSVWVPKSDGSPISRLKGWIIFSAQAFAHGIGLNRVGLVYGSTPHLLAPLVAWMVARLRGVPYILEVRDLWPEMFVTTGVLDRGSRVYAVLRRLEKFIACHADAIVTVAAGWEDHFSELGVDPRRIVWIPNGSKSVAVPNSEQRKKLRVEHRVFGTTVIYAGAHGFANGLNEVLDAAKELKEANFILVGSGQEKVSLMQRVHDEGISNVEFRPPMDKDKLMHLLTACDIGIHSLRPYDTLQKGMSPNKMYDYMAAGLAVVSNAGEASKEILGDESERGVSVDSGALLVGLKKVLNMSEYELSVMRGNARRAIDESFSLSASALRLERLLTEVSTPGWKIPTKSV